MDKFKKLGLYFSTEDDSGIKQEIEKLIDEISSDTNKVKSELTNAQINSLQDQMEDTLVSKKLVDLLNEFNPESADPADQEEYQTLLKEFNNLVKEFKENPERRQELLEKIINKKTELQDFIMDVDPKEFDKHEELNVKTIKRFDSISRQNNDAEKQQDAVINKYGRHTKLGQETAAPQKATAPCCTVS